MSVTAKVDAALALVDPEGQWELHEGHLREKPPMTHAHNEVAFELGFELRAQLGRGDFRVRVDSARVRRLDVTHYIPDVFVYPARLAEPLRNRRDVLELYDEPLPLVVEVWSPSTTVYDADTKLPEYKRRGDLEIWRVHPYDRIVTIWRRQDDGNYSEEVMTGGIVRPTFLPNVTIDLDDLFARL